MKSYCEHNYICAHCGKVVYGDPDINKCACSKEWEEQLDNSSEGQEDNIETIIDLCKAK